MRTLRTDSPVLALAYSADGRSLVSGDAGGLLRVWDTATGEERQQLAAHKAQVNAVAFSPAGDAVASVGTDCRACLWDLSRASGIHFGQGSPLMLCAVAFSPDGSAVAYGGGEGIIHLYPIAGKPRWKGRMARMGLIAALAFAPDGKILASGDWKSDVRLWKPRTANALATLQHPSYVNALAFSPRGDLLAVASGPRILLWDPQTRQKHRELTGHDKRVTALAFAPDKSVLYSGSLDSVVKVWDVAGQRERATLDWGTGPVRGVAVAPDGMTAAASGDAGGVVLWDVED